MTAPGMAPNSVIYIAQPIGGGPFKFGVSANYKLRTASLSPWSPTGIEVVALIPGNVAREQVLLAALRPFRHHGEWIKAAPAVWRVVLEAIDTGDIAWLPQPPAMRLYSQNGKDEVALIVAHFGGVEATALALGYTKAAILSRLYEGLSSGLWARYQIHLALQEGRLPAYLAEAHKAVRRDAAA